MSDKAMTEQAFIYKLNAMEDAGAQTNPAKRGYKEKREAVLAHVADLERRIADLQARLDRAEAETIERCWKEAWSKGAPDHIVQAIRALAAAGGQESAATQDNQANSPFTDGVEPSPSSGVLPNTSGPAPAADPIIAHSKSMYKRLVTQGANVVPPAAPGAAGWQTESAATQDRSTPVPTPAKMSAPDLVPAADPALPGLEILASHSGKSQNREWHSVGTWLYPGEAIYEGTLK